MFDTLKSLFSTDQNAPQIDDRDEKALAAAALMVEVAAVEDGIADEEWQAIAKALESHFGLTATETETLINEAHLMQSESVQLFGFTHTLKDHYPPQTRVEILEMLWEVVLADGVIGAHEEALIRKLAGLLYVSDRERGDAKKRALTKLHRSS